MKEIVQAIRILNSAGKGIFTIYDIQDFTSLDYIKVNQGVNSLRDMGFIESVNSSQYKVV